MDVILLNDVEKLGLRGEVVHVADGYARNFLLPRKLAERATPAKVAELEKREAQRARHEAASAEQAQSIADTLRKTVLTFEVQSGPTGTLFGSVTSTNIADEIWRTRKIRVDRRKIALDDSIKRIGRYAVPITVFEGVEVEVKTLVVPEGGELPPEEELAAMEAAEEAARLEAAGTPTAEEGSLLEEEAELVEVVDETPERDDAVETDDSSGSAVEQPGDERPGSTGPGSTGPGSTGTGSTGTGSTETG